MSVDLRSDTVWQAVADYIRAQLGVTLSLKACEQGNYLNLPPSDDVGDLLPMVLVDVTDAPGKVLPGFAGHELRHHVTIHYLVAISDTEISDRKTRDGRDQIANLFAQVPFDGPAALPGYSGPVFQKSGVSLRILPTFTELELPIGHGTVEFDVTMHYDD